MTRRQLLRGGLLAGVGALAAPLLNLGRCRLLALTGSPISVSTQAVDLVLGSTVVDMLGLLTLDWPQLSAWHRDPGQFLEADFRHLEASGVNIFHPAVETSKRDAYRGALAWISGWNRLLGAQGCFLARIDSITSLLLAPKLGKLGILIGFQNATHFRTAADVEFFYRLGQRVSQLTYNAVNRLGSGCYEARDRGLTAFGAEVVAEMNRLGMAVDLSHCGDRTCLDALAASKEPVLVTHANCKALVPGQRRCKPDEVIRRLARGGGVMGITAVRSFVSRRSNPTIEHLLDHFDHVRRLVGVEHVGLGSDVDFKAIDSKTGAPHPFYAIRGLDPGARVFQIADGLLRRGWAGRDVQLVLGGNFLRVLARIFPDSSWTVVPERETRRDPFCPAPHRVGPLPTAP